MKVALILAVILLIIAPISSRYAVQGQKVSAGYDKTAAFSNYKTYTFDSKGGARNPIVNQMIIDATERELKSRGLTKVDDNADLKIVFLAASGFNLQVAAVSFGYNVNPAYSGLVPSAGTASWDVVTGTLLIDLFDQKTERIVFRGTAKDTLQRAPTADIAADAKTVSKTVNKVITKIFKKYPKRR